MRWQAGVLAVVVVGLVTAAFLVGRSTGDNGGTERAIAEPASASTHAGYALLQTQRCHTELAVPIPPTPLAATTRAALPASAASGLVAYRDTAGTTIIAPRGWECEAGIGADGGERISAYPPGHDDPAEPPFGTGEVVSLQLIPACQGCIAEAVCALFPRAKVVRDYATIGSPDCPPKPLREQVTHVSRATVVYVDPPKVEGTGTGSGGAAPTIGALSFSEGSGVRKVSCTLPAHQAEVCAGIVGATMLAAPLY